MKKTNFKKYVLPAVFAGIIFSVAALYLVLPKRTYSENEKRYLASFPKFGVSSVFDGTFGKELETYMADHIAGRDFFVGLNAYFSLATGRNSVSDVYKCKDGYLINSPNKANSEVFEKNLSRFEGFTKKVKLPSTLMIVPSAGYIMEDYLPKFHGKYRDDELFALASRLTPSISFLDTRNTLSGAVSQGKQMYYRTDHHLTSAANYELYALFCDFSVRDCPARSKYEVETYDGFCGTTKSSSGYFLEKDNTLEIWNAGDSVKVQIDDGDKKEEADSLFFKENLKNKDKYPVFAGGNHALVKITNENAKDGSILVVKDSFAQCFSTFLTHSFKEIYMVDLRYYRGSVSNLAEENDIDEILYMYGIDSLLTDTNSVWLF